MYSRYFSIRAVVVVLLAVVLTVATIFVFYIATNAQAADSTIYLPLIENSISTIIPDNTKILSSETTSHLSSISEDGGLFSFTETTAQLKALQEGNIIVSDVSTAAPNGFLRKVTNITTTGNQVQIATIPATLEDALQQGSLSIHKQLTPNDIDYSEKLDGVLLRQAKGIEIDDKFTIELKDVVMFDEDGNYDTKSDQIVADGSIEIAPEFDFALTVESWQLKYLRFVFTAKETGEIKIRANVAALDLRRKEVEVTRIRLKPIITSIGILPVVIIPELVIVVGIDGKIHIGLETGVSQNATLQGGVQYSESDWANIGSNASSFHFLPPTISAELEVKAYTSPQLILLLYGLVGPYAKPEIGFELKVTPFADQFAEANGYVDMFAGAEVTVLGHKIADYHARVIGYKIKIWSLAHPTQTATPSPTISTPSSTATIINTVTNTPSTSTPTPITTELPIIDHCGNVAFDEIWTAESIHRVTCNVSLEEQSLLRIEAGTVVKFFGTGLRVDGELVIAGAVDKPVYLTSLKDDSVGGDSNGDGFASYPNATNWGAITVGATGSLSMNYATLRYGGQYIMSNVVNMRTGLYNEGGDIVVANSTIAENFDAGVIGLGGHLSVISSTIEHHNYYGIFVNDDSPTLINNQFKNNGNQPIGSGADIYVDYKDRVIAPIQGNTFVGSYRPTDLNNGILGSDSIQTGNKAITTTQNSFFLQNMNITGSVTLPLISNLVYVLSANIPQGQRLTIEAGTVIKFVLSTGLTVNGELVIAGTAEKPVYLTSWNDNSVGGVSNEGGWTPGPASWGSVIVGPTGSLLMNYTTLRYGGQQAFGGLHTALYNEGGNITITNSTITDNFDVGLLSTGGDVSIGYTNIYSNTAFGVYNLNTETLIIAENNWWGANSGPDPYGAGNGINYQSCYDSEQQVYYICQYHVDAEPWLTHPAN